MIKFPSQSQSDLRVLHYRSNPERKHMLVTLVYSQASESRNQVISLTQSQSDLRVLHCRLNPERKYACHCSVE